MSTIRLLQCVDCRSIEVLPGYSGPADRDETLIYLTDKHRFPDGNYHRGNLINDPTVSGTDGTLRPATIKDWNNPKFRKLLAKELDKTITRPGQGAGLGQKFYDTKDTFQADALTCYKRHLRPPEGCQDYKDPRFKLMPDTRQERKSEGLGKYQSNRFLCEFCPVESWYITQRRKAAKMYDE